MATTHASALPHRGAPSYARSPAPPSQPAGTFLPGTKVQVGNHRVVIEKYLSEGGFAHVYVVRIPRDGNKHELAVLKRVAVPDRDHLANMRTEVETMKKLKGHTKVVTYMDSHASQLKGGGYEVFLLMEFCAGGGLIDFMNTRLQHRLTEPEILKIFGDVAEGVACMHYLKPPLLHRDLKVENVLISKSGSGTPTYKLCDFGSTAPPRPAAKTAEEGRQIEEDVQKHTTMQYRSPEMIDVWRKQPIDEKADIWALGVLLYKLCYYTTPFEDVGQMAILNASYKYPQYPSFSSRLKKLIAWMLKEKPQDRPNIYQVIKEVCNMRGTEVPIKDIYANRTHSEARRNESLPSQDTPAAPIGLQKAEPQVSVQSIPEIAPMRRGRPQAAPQSGVPAKQNASPARGDPFAALDSKNYNKDSNFQFGMQPSPAPATSPRPASGLHERVTNALADEVFGQTKPKVDVPRSQSTTQMTQRGQVGAQVARAAEKRQEVPQATPTIQHPQPVRSGVTYISTGTNPSPPPAKPPKPQQKLPEVSNRPIWRVPTEQERPPSQPRASEAAQAAASSLQPSLPPTQRPALLDIHRSKSQTATATVGSASSSRPSLEGRNPSELDLGGDSGLNRTRSAQTRQRPSSVYLSSNLDFLRDQESARKRPSLEMRRPSRQASRERDAPFNDAPIVGDMDFLRSSEDADGLQRKVSRKDWGAGHRKRSSLGESISGAKSMFAGKFNDAFKRFEREPGDTKNEQGAASFATPPLEQGDEELVMLSPITGSDATPSRYSDNDSLMGETEELPPDVRRELERQRLSQEEKRVAEAAAQYRARVSTQGTGSMPPPSRASTIQKRVQSLLDEGRQSPVKRTAEGYGQYTDVPTSSEATEMPTQRPEPQPAKAQPPPLAKKPAATESGAMYQYPKLRQQQPTEAPQTSPQPPTQQSETARIVSRPSVPPKSQALRTGQRTGQWPPPQSDIDSTRPAQPKPSGLAALLAKDLEGVPDYPTRGSSMTGSAGSSATPSVSAAIMEPIDTDVEADFSKRYPSLSGIEMVETDIGGGPGERRLRMRDI
ncbi:serine/threonine kinase ARK1 [Teratosphaeria destructans]|uniref:non-specific serine/threonine protein kinase n=1 Tax=Teratosphaeria destructans TaxID=418781 RepID=A0A9W7W231_9PEZI|nr:serine/threonine kinase ARK1 [Teratosphaeria destructans]